MSPIRARNPSIVQEDASSASWCRLKTATAPVCLMEPTSPQIGSSPQVYRRFQKKHARGSHSSRKSVGTGVTTDQSQPFCNVMRAYQEPPTEHLCGCFVPRLRRLVEGDLLTLETAAPAVVVEAPTTAAAAAATAATTASEVTTATAAAAATTATTKTAAAEVAAATAAEVAAATAAEFALGSGSRVVQADGATGAGLAIESLQSRLGLFHRVERDVGEAFGTSTLPAEGVSTEPQPSRLPRTH